MSIRRTTALVSVVFVLAACTTGGGATTAPSTAASAPAASAPAASEPAASAAACKVAVSWNNFQQPRWAANDEPNIKETVEAGRRHVHHADANLSNEQQLTDIDTLISKGANVLVLLAQDNKAVLPGPPEGQGCRDPGHRL